MFGKQQWFLKITSEYKFIKKGEFRFGKWWRKIALTQRPNISHIHLSEVKAILHV